MQHVVACAYKGSIAVQVELTGAVPLHLYTLDQQST